MPEIVSRKGCSHSTLKFTDRRLMYKQLSITYDYFGILNCVCVLFCSVCFIPSSVCSAEPWQTYRQAIEAVAFRKQF